ncbi:MAG: M20/M25/M40 family metallo-hydrolase [Clostridia bacterium]|nr:M20/M25/M40 family metallo-hydrolase [Clostridia bacterium]
MTFSQAKKLIKKIYAELASIPAVSGDEELCAEKVKHTVESLTDFFTEFSALPAGGMLFTHRCGIENAKKLLIDAHFDTVGFAVTELLDGGFVRVSPVGGVDRRLLFASEIEIYGKKTVKGVFVSNPPHLSKNSNDSDALPQIEDIPVDTGLSDKALRDTVSVGDTAGFVFSPCEMLNDILCGRSMDNRICATAAVLSAIMLSQDEEYRDECDIILSLSSAEEVNGTGGAYLGKLCADAAVVLDVNFGRDKDIPENVSYNFGEGCGVSYSCTTSRAFSDCVVNGARMRDIPICTLVEAKHTGTNAHHLANAHLATPCAVLSIPEKYMHQAHETVDMKDVYSCARTLCAVAYDFPDSVSELEKCRVIKKLPAREV